MNMTEALLALPDQIAIDSTQIVTLNNEKLLIEKKIGEIEVAVNLQINTDPQYKNDGARRAAIKDILAQNKDYEQYCITRDRIKHTIDLTVIAHQCKRDMFNAYLAIVKL